MRTWGREHEEGDGRYALKRGNRKEAKEEEEKKQKWRAQRIDKKSEEWLVGENNRNKM